MSSKSIITDAYASSCYFRTTVDHPHRKALVQINEPCNLHCAHCFVSANRRGKTMTLEDIRTKVIPRLVECRVNRVTLTGGEPFLHPDLLDVVAEFRAAGMEVGLCTNATLSLRTSTSPPWSRWATCTSTCRLTGSPPNPTASSVVTARQASRGEGPRGTAPAPTG